MRALLATAAIAAATCLAACGSATVESDPAPSVAPLERATASESASESADADATASASEGAGNGRDGGSSSGGLATTAQDRGAREVTETPTIEPDVTDAEQAYLDGVAGGGINIEGVQDQLIGAANAACNPDDNVTVGAVAGQIIAQGRTDQPFEAVVALLEEQARTGYC